MKYNPDIKHIACKDNIRADYFRGVDFKDHAEEAAKLNDLFPFLLAIKKRALLGMWQGTNWLRQLQ